MNCCGTLNPLLEQSIVRATGSGNEDYVLSPKFTQQSLSDCAGRSECLADCQAGDGHPLASCRVSLVLATRCRGGRPKVLVEIRQLIRATSLANPLWPPTSFATAHVPAWVDGFSWDGLSEQRDQLALSDGVTVDVALCGINRLMAGQQLHVPQAPAGAMHILGGGGDERSPS